MSEVIDENYEIIDADSWELKRDMIDRFQELSGRKLTESSPETLIFETVAYMIGLREEKYNDEMKQNYLRFARDERLDLKGEFYGNRGKRLVEQPAVATFRFYITNIQATDIIIPKGSRVQYNELYFSTDEQYKIEKGDLYVDGIATCNTSGTVGNDIPVGQINTMVDIYPHYDKVENITATNNGAEIEQDDNYRARNNEEKVYKNSASVIKKLSEKFKVGENEIFINTPEITEHTVYKIRDKFYQIHWVDNNILVEQMTVPYVDEIKTIKE